ncbi:protein rolling stone isoform X1 [Bactrocera dorsalis]|uniref:Protein rolling stone isoform X1 n=1 Tax=Bactrocera dorsalis TaxID=27457 RepID=A0A6I9V3N1_BACDO|nr:protein rolling stone isoform X1 [Bactrocera dorsalis]
MDVQVQISESGSQCCSCRCWRHNGDEPVNSFFKSQWQKSEWSILFLIYRWCFATWLVVTMGLSLELFFFDGKWFIYFTNWGYLLCTFVALLSAILVTVYCFTAPKTPCPRWMVELYWHLHISAFVCAIGLSFLYWAFIYPFSNFKVPEGIHRIEIIRLYRYFFDGPDNHSCLAYFHNINSHAINSVLMIIDQVVVAFPTRIIHFVYPALIVIAYLVFSIVYFLIGGENVIGKPYIYRILNWGEYPVSSALVACSGLLLVVPMCVLAFLIYKLRVWVSSGKCLS